MNNTGITLIKWGSLHLQRWPPPAAPDRFAPDCTRSPRSTPPPAAHWIQDTRPTWWTTLIRRLKLKLQVKINSQGGTIASGHSLTNKKELTTAHFSYGKRKATEVLICFGGAGTMPSLRQRDRMFWLKRLRKSWIIPIIWLRDVIGNKFTDKLTRFLSTCCGCIHFFRLLMAWRASFFTRINSDTTVSNLGWLKKTTL